MEAFAAQLEVRLHKKITLTHSSQECLEGADIMVEATRLTEPQPLLKTENIEKIHYLNKTKNSIPRFYI